MAEQKRYWFPTKRLGWGWGLPQAWQGWVVLVLYVAGMATVMQGVREPQHPLGTAIAILSLNVGFLLIYWLKGEPPRWRNGR